jgi:hypothetical protein
MTRTTPTKIEADNLDKISIFQLRKANKLGKYPSRLEVIDDIGYTEDTFQLTSTNCYFGGKRHWIKCHCERRVGVLYRVEGVYACLNCHTLSYQSRNLKKSIRSDSLLKLCDEMIKVQIMQKGLKRFTYAGEPTKKVREITSFHLKLFRIFG